mgnify:FL=1
MIIFDEVQLFPQARQAIKYLVADGRYEYIETGSLISIRKNVKDILIPSEEYRIKMYPMDFEEYLWAINDEVTIPTIREAFEKKKATWRCDSPENYEKLSYLYGCRWDAAGSRCLCFREKL